MRIVLESSWRRVELMHRWEEVGPWEPGARTMTLLPAGEGARQFLLRYVSDARVMAALRSLLGWRNGSPSRDAGRELIEQVCRLLALGELLLLQFEIRPRPYLTTPAEPAAPSPVSTATAQIEPPAAAETTCTNPACKCAFEDAADQGTPLVDADSPGCAPAKEAPSGPPPVAAPAQPAREDLQCTNPGIKTAFGEAAADGTPLVECGEHCQC